MTADEVANAVAAVAANMERFAGATPAGIAYAIRHSPDWRMVLIASMREMARPTPDWETVARIADCRTFDALADWERWSAVGWRVRADWLGLVEAALEFSVEPS